jgi:hypothetical protein
MITGRISRNTDSTTFHYGNSPSEIDQQEYLEIITDAWKIYQEKEAIRRGLWKDYPAKHQNFHIQIKADRVARTLEFSELTEDQTTNVREELLDIINYCTFAVRKLDGAA